jgi:putative CocE/NonD family hydrolase
MPDDDAGSDAWTVTPSAYLKTRPGEYAIGAPRSRYLAMRDGCRLALDVYLPADAPARVPAILILTPYYRRFALEPGARAEPSPGAARFRDLFVPRGYALVVVDVRGTGASFGTRDGFRSPRERDDYGEIAAWVAAQDWCDGRIGATGISYVGAACDFLASTGHPAVRAIAPLFAVWDTYADHYYPGGVLLNRLAENYDRLMVALDHDRRDLVSAFAYFREPAFRGPQPVDEDADGALCREAIAEHRGDFRMPDFITEFRFREEALPYDPTFSSASFSPYAYAEGIRPDVAVLSVSGWMDGAGYANGAIARHLTLPNARKHLLLGPWDHGARVNVSPWRDRVAPRFHLEGELLRFFDHYLSECDTGLDREQPVHVFEMHAERWTACAAWPPAPRDHALHLGAHTLEAGAGEAGGDIIRADFAAGTGTHTRYERLAAENNTDYYPDWRAHTAHMTHWVSAPLEAPATLAGHAVVELWIACTEPDAAIHAYLSEQEADGTWRHVTEGVLRALHRAEAPAPAAYRADWPFRRFSRADAAPLVPGAPTLLRFALLPVAWSFARGSRIVLSIALADADHHAQVPHGRPPTVTVLRGGAHPSRVLLPLSAG